MARLAEIQSHIESIGGLLDIVGAMRSLAGMRVHEAQRSLAAIRHYSESVAASIAAALLLLPEPPAGSQPARDRRAVVVFASEHGFVGAFNDRVLEAAGAIVQPREALLVLGSRGAALATERGLPVAWSTPMASHPAGAPETARGLAAELYRRIARGEVTRIELVHARQRRGAAGAIEHRVLLPLDLAALHAEPPRQAPLHNLAPGVLLEKLTAEYVLALLMEAAVESIASENAARLATMESARGNVSRKLDELRQAARLTRQDEITMELLDIATGAAALGDA